MPNVPERPSTNAPSPAEASHTNPQDPDWDYDDGLLSNAAPIMAAAYGLALGVLLLTFDGDTVSILRHSRDRRLSGLLRPAFHVDVDPASP